MANKTHQRTPTTSSNIEERYRMIAEAAYYKAEKRGFRGGSPEVDWAEAEAEIVTLLTEKNPRRGKPTPQRKPRSGASRSARHEG